MGRRVTYLRLSLTDRCNYRCTYCMPEQGVALAAREEVLSFEEIERIVACFARVGVRRVRLTGGEPTVRKELVELVRRLARIPGIDELMLTTNGHVLAELARPLREAGLGRINVSLDSLRPDRFRSITRRGDLARDVAGIDAARAAGFRALKINVVALKGFNDDEVADLCRFAWQRGAVPRFIEVMPMAGGDLYLPGSLLPAAEIRARLLEAHPEGSVLVPLAGAGTLPGAGPARYWRLDLPAGEVAGEVGIVSAMTEHFCDTCNRVRLSATGQLHTCLARDEAYDLKRALREQGEDAVLGTVRAALAVKKEGHEFQLSGCGGPRKYMVSIGG
jgi:cyclic pyranopterin phosphate synthase